VNDFGFATSYIIAELGGVGRMLTVFEKDMLEILDFGFDSKSNRCWSEERGVMVILALFD